MVRQFALLFLLGAITLCSCGGPSGFFPDEAYAELRDALHQRLDNDDAILTWSFGIDSEGDSKGWQSWLTVEVALPGGCNSSASDPCTTLADEIAKLAFDSYRRVEELTGIRVIFGSKLFYLSVEASDIIFRKSLTIEEWRNRLSLAD